MLSTADPVCRARVQNSRQCDLLDMFQLFPLGPSLFYCGSPRSPVLLLNVSSRYDWSLCVLSFLLAKTSLIVSVVFSFPLQVRKPPRLSPSFIRFRIFLCFHQTKVSSIPEILMGFNSTTQVHVDRRMIVLTVECFKISICQSPSLTDQLVASCPVVKHAGLNAIFFARLLSFSFSLVCFCLQQFMIWGSFSKQ